MFHIHVSEVAKSFVEQNLEEGVVVLEVDAQVPVHLVDADFVRSQGHEVQHLLAELVWV